MDPPNTRILPYNSYTVLAAAQVIAGGGCVAMPTETVYGLAADATDGAAVAGVYAAKGRPSFNPLIVHVADLCAAKRLAAFDARAEALAKAFWPGPLTLVLPLKASSGIASLVTAGLETIALRVPDHRAMRALLKASGLPLAAPSANPSGTISPTRVEHVLRGMNGRIPLIIDDGPTRQGIESTIVREVFGVTRILRHGPITERDVRAVLNGVSGEQRVKWFDKGEDATLNEGAAVEAPGQLASHYAPRKPLRIDVIAAEEGEYWIGFGRVAGDANLSAGGDLAEAAANLFELLHRADASAEPKIAVAPVPEDGIGAAINDRLRRAAFRDG